MVSEFTAYFPVPWCKTQYIIKYLKRLNSSWHRIHVARSQGPGKGQSAASRGHNTHPPPLTLSLTYTSSGCEDEDPKTSLYPRPLRWDHGGASDGSCGKEGIKDNQEQDAAAGAEEGEGVKKDRMFLDNQRQATIHLLQGYRDEKRNEARWKESLIREWNKEKLNSCIHNHELFYCSLQSQWGQCDDHFALRLRYIWKCLPTRRNKHNRCHIRDTHPSFTATSTCKASHANPLLHHLTWRKNFPFWGLRSHTFVARDHPIMFLLFVLDIMTYNYYDIII